MGNHTVAKDILAWFGSHEYVDRDEKDARENVAKSKIKVKLAIPERNNASAATEHRKFRRGLYLARGVQSNGRHNNTWTPVVNFGRSAGVSYPRVRPLLVFSSGATHRRSTYQGPRLLVHTRTYHVGNGRSSLWSFLSSARTAALSRSLWLRVLFRVNRA